MPKPCLNIVCDNTVSDASGMDFCFTCSAALLRARDELYGDIDKVLSLEAQFVRYCEEHGLPHPHE